MSKVEIIAAEIKQELSKPEVVRAIMATTFKGLDEKSARQALMEGMIRGFDFNDFLEKRVYAIPFGKEGGYSLITSIDYARAIGMKNGIVGKDAPVFEEREGSDKPLSCTVTVKRKVQDYIGEYAATVYYDEYYKAGKNGYPSLWDSKPRTMLAKVAEMHALRMACPEELDKAYIEDEMNEGKVIDAIDSELQAKIDNAKTPEEVNTIYQENKGKGKAFDKAIVARKRELESEPKINYPVSEAKE